ncbi:MAG TPA: response regulator, partial [Blastocatellia bacterium]|nr:response regulator [Blastocatellia bacterium]
DLIITDLNMPYLSGIDLIRRLRELPELNSVAILTITSYGLETAVETLKAGADRALARPVENHLLLAFVRDLLNRKR